MPEMPYENPPIAWPTTIGKLDQLAELKSKLDALLLQKAALVDSVMTPEIKAKLTEIDIEFAAPYEECQAQIAPLETEIREEVAAQGATIRGAHLMAVYMRGRITWDGRKLDGMMVLIPQLREARKEGDPSVQIRKV
jgi:hypothetical protein